MTKPLQGIKERLEEKLNECFPKGEAKMRGEALFLFASFMIELNMLVKAFGGCMKCWGKGYGTQTVYTSGRNFITKLPTVVFCTCPRGKQLKKLWGCPTNVDL